MATVRPASQSSTETIVDEFPALKKLHAVHKRRRIPFVQQMQWSDCGAACLAMVLKSFGREVDLEDVRHVTGVDREGVDAVSLLRGAEFYGLRGRGLKLDVAG